MVGRAATADLPIPSASASLRHVYLHLDRRGVFAVDMASRTGTRFDESVAGARACWLRPGQGFELAGHRVELREVDLGPLDDPSDASNASADPLAEAPGLVPMVLIPEDDPAHPLSLLSELSFLGRGHSCAVKVSGPEVARIHGVIVRRASTAFLIDLVGRGLSLGDQAVGPATLLRDGDRLAIGAFRFVVRLGEPARLAAPTPQAPSTILAATLSRIAPATPPELREAMTAWTLQAVQAGQAELMQRQEQMQRSLVAAVRQLYLDQAALMDRQFRRLDRLHEELAELRDELRRRLDAPPSTTTPALDRPDDPPDPPPWAAPQPPPNPATPGRPPGCSTGSSSSRSRSTRRPDRAGATFSARLGPLTKAPDDL